MAKKVDIDSGVLRQRRNLIGVSLGLILYEFAGGEFSGVSSPFGIIKLQNPGALIVAAWLSLFYFIWRYWLYSTPKEKTAIVSDISPDLDTFGRDVQIILSDSKKFRVMAETLLFEQCGVTATEPTPILIYGFFTRKFDYSYHVTNRSEGAVSQDFQGKVVKVPYLKFIFTEIRAQLEAIAKYKTFSDYILPYLVAYVAILVGIYFHWPW